LPPAQPSTARPVNHAAASFRTRVVHCIAVAPRTPDDLVRMVARQEPSDLTRKPFVDLLEHVRALFAAPDHSLELTRLL
ncbi:hypothetical protein FA95DRAFT_1562472, partial [Auriscalpium vulgare]